MPRREGDEELLRPVRKGGTLLDVMWADLLSCIDALMEPDESYEDDSDSGWNRDRMEGRAEGVAWCIAVLTQSPRPVDINPIKQEAMERWQALQEA